MKVTYYVAICVFLVCLATIVIKMTFWPVCGITITGNTTANTTCDGWTVAGLTAGILGIAAAFLGILGAILLAAWWTGLDARVEQRVTDAFKTQIQTVQSSIDQLKTEVQTVQSALGQLTPNIQTMQANLTQFNTQLETMEDGLKAEKEQLRDVQGSIAQLSGQAASLIDAIENVSQKTEIAQRTAASAYAQGQPEYLAIPTGYATSAPIGPFHSERHLPMEPGSGIDEAIGG